MADEGNTALHGLTADGTEVLQRLLEHGLDINAVNGMGETPLLSHLRCGAPSCRLVREMLSARAEVGRSDMMGETPLMEAACMGDRSLCLLLLESKADIGQCNLQGQRAEALASTAGFPDLAELLGDPRQPWRKAEALTSQAAEQVEEAVAKPAAERPRGRPARGALRQKCEEQGIPLDLLGQLAAADLLREKERLQALSLEALAAEAGDQGLAEGDRRQLAARLWHLRLWKLLPLQALQEQCRQEASHVVVHMQSAEGEPLSREELIEALAVAKWGGQTKSQQISQRCADKGIPDDKLENRARAEHLLSHFVSLESMGRADLARRYKGVGFAYGDDLSEEFIVSALKEYALCQEMSLSHLRQLCKEKGLAIRGEHRRADLLKLLSLESWKPFDIPVTKLPSILVAQGLLDQVQRLAKKELSQLTAECRRRQLPAEAAPAKEALLGRLRRHLVWAQMSVEDLEEECRCRDVQLPSKAEKPAFKMHAELSRKKELLELLQDWLSIEMLEGKGIPVKQLGPEVALAVFMEVERYESMPRSLLLAEYEMLGMPSEPKLDDKELQRRLKQALVWSQLEVEELQEECQARDIPLAHASQEEKRQLLLDKLILSLGVDGWEKQGIPVGRLTSIEAAIMIVEELARLEEEKEEKVKDAYKLLGLPHEVLDKAAMISRLKHYLVWQELRPSELRKECIKHNILASGDLEDLVTMLVLKSWGVLPEESATDRNRFQPPPRRPAPAPPPPASTKVASAFQVLGLEVTAPQDQVRKAYRRLALQHHPDKNPGLQQEQAAKKFQQITSAYDIAMGHLKLVAAHR
ncbi:unnamed protein product [Effrenium voratum]|nr:unnamed protein product [Effrenium voratum]